MNSVPELMNTYTLKNKDKPIINFELYKTEQKILGIKESTYYINILNIHEENTDLLPTHLQKDLTAEKLLKWIEDRKAPKNRQFVDKILQSIEDSANPLKYVDVSHSLSLNDSLWITNDLLEHKWADFNLYDHPFDEILSYVAFTGHSQKISGVRTSPELTSSGALKKCWSNRENEIILIKGDDFLRRDDGRSQAVMEYYAAQIAEKMGLYYTPYDLEIFHHHSGEKETVCTCPLFTSADVGLINAYDFFLKKGIDIEHESPKSLKLQAKMAEAYGIGTYCDMMVFDTLICNQDRHLGNFGYLINNNTGELLKPAPLYDNGFSFIVGASKYDLENIPEYISSVSGKYLSFETQARAFTRERHIPMLRKMQHFHFKRHDIKCPDEDIIVKMEEAIRYQAKYIIKQFYKAKDGLDSPASL